MLLRALYIAPRGSCSTRTYRGGPAATRRLVRARYLQQVSVKNCEVIPSRTKPCLEPLGRLFPERSLKVPESGGFALEARHIPSICTEYSRPDGALARKAQVMQKKVHDFIDDVFRPPSICRTAAVCLLARIRVDSVSCHSPPQLTSTLLLWITLRLYRAETSGLSFWPPVSLGYQHQCVKGSSRCRSTPVCLSLLASIRHMMASNGSSGMMARTWSERGPWSPAVGGRELRSLLLPGSPCLPGICAATDRPPDW